VQPEVAGPYQLHLPLHAVHRRFPNRRLLHPPRRWKMLQAHPELETRVELPRDAPAKTSSRKRRFGEVRKSMHTKISMRVGERKRRWEKRRKVGIQKERVRTEEVNGEK
jgi:hypothetical protein